MGVDEQEPSERPQGEPAIASSATRVSRRVTITIGWPSASTFALLGILVLAATLRFVGLGWGGNLYLHPDERFQTMVVTGLSWPDSLGAWFDSQRSPLNPYNNGFTTYIYGTFPLFLAKLAGLISGQTDYGDAHLPGRFLSGLCDLISITLLYLTGRRLFSTAAGLLAAALLSVTVLSIQTAHFFVADSFVILFCLAAFYLSLRAQASARWGWYLATGLMIGLALSSKLSAVPIILTLAIPLGECWRQSGWRSIARSVAGTRLSPLTGSVAALITAILTFRVFQPYAFLGQSILSFRLDPRWVNDLQYWRVVQAGNSDTPPNLQWVDRAPVLFGLKNMVLWGMGPFLGITVLAGLGWAVVALATRRHFPPVWQLFLVGWPLFHLIYFGFGFVQTGRYFLPAYPFLVLLGAALLVQVARAGADRGWPSLPIPGLPRVVIPVSAIPAIIVVAITLLYAVAFVGIYTRPTTREVASRWIYDSVPPGSVIATEHWDDGVPVNLPGYDPTVFTGFQLELFFVDDQAKLNTLLDQLDRADYLAITSNRLYAVIPRLHDRYPMTSVYYRMLFAGQLGFDLERSFTSYPSLGGLSIDDGGAEEAFTVYDHPEVFIFHKSPTYDRATIAASLQSALGDGGIAVPLPDAAPDLLMMSDAERVTQQSSGTWSQIYDPSDLANRAPVLVWYLALQLMALTAIPLCWRLFPGLPDRGWAVAKTLGLLGTAYGAWLLASTHLLAFGPDAIAIGILAIATLSVLAIWQRWPLLWADLRTRWRSVVTAEILFLVAFLAVVWLRMQNPDLWHPDRGGEKPMDFAFLNAVIRSTHFPPYDPWFAGGYIHYYYFGYVIWGSVSRLTGIVPEVAFNLAVPSILALVVINCWSVALACLSRLVRSARSVRFWRLPLLALLAPALVAGLGNLSLVTAIGEGKLGYPDSGLDGSLPHLFGIPAFLGGLWNAVIHHPTLPSDSYWAPTRIIPGTINEFPFFSVLFADLHAHLMAMPLATATLVIVVHLVLVPPGARPRQASLQNDPDELFRPAEAWTRRAVRPSRGRAWSIDPAWLTMATLAGFLTSALYATNTWDYPAYLLLVTGSFAIGRCVRSGWRGTYILLRETILFGLAVVVTGRVLFWSFFSHFPTNTSLVATDDRSTLDDFLTIHAIFLVAAGGLLAMAGASLWRQGRPVDLSFPARVSVPPAGEGTGTQLRLSLTLQTSRVMVGTLVVVTLLLVLALAVGVGSLTIFLAGAIACAIVAGWVFRRDAIRLLLATMIGLALVLALFAEHRTISGDVGRLNVVFKLYLDIWILLAMVGAIVIAMVLATARLRSLTASRIWLGAVALLIAGGLVYPLAVTGSRIGDRFIALPPTLDGMAYMDRVVYTAQADGQPPVEIPLSSDLDAITWLRDHIEGSPVVLEATLPGYRWGSRVSVYTGLPTVLGWDWHETQQRPGYGALIDQRRSDVTAMFAPGSSFESITPLLDRYHVRVIYLGLLEQAYYGDEGLAKFRDAASRGLLDLIYDANGVAIYAYGG